MPRQRRASAERTRDRTPLSIRSSVPLDAATRSHIEAQVRTALARLGVPIERASVQFADVSGPRGGVDTRCHIEIVFSGGERVLDEERAPSAPQAAARTLLRLTRMARSEVARFFTGSPKRTVDTAEGATAMERASGSRSPKARPESAVYALEDSAGEPSRKSTRASSNRIKAATQLTRRTQRAVSSPEARAARKK